MKMSQPTEITIKSPIRNRTRKGNLILHL